MKLLCYSAAAILILLGALTSARAETAFDAPGNFNPIVPGYFADPTIEQFGDTFYLYATTDGNGGGRGPATVWLSKDFVNWVLVAMNWPTTPFYWAPDVVRRPDGRYYLFYNQPCNTFAGVSDSPLGPWTPLTPGDGLVIKDRLVKDVITLDTQIFEDKDGQLYGYWGTWGIYPNSGCGWGVFNPDMKSFARLGMIPNTQAKDFFEGPYMIERNGVYYFTYSSGSCGDSTYRVQYAVSDKPDGEFKMGPNNPILATTPDGKVDGPGHHSILKRGDDCFIVYHRHDIPVTPNGMHRQTCADRLVFERDGVIKKVEPTHAGIGYLAPKARSANLAFGKKVTASSFYRDTLRNHAYRPEYAVDDNNATLWRPADNGP
ncbi:MAG TPA: family 43 glycosylhydrolase, partial [Candidatus Paceibacterota bacterium]|nr:family 43 glycosylhydrolase [Candidatus Paceibacterota bacterium]